MEKQHSAEWISDLVEMEKQHSEEEAALCRVDLRSGGDGEALRLHVQWGVHGIVEQADEQNGFMEQIRGNFQGDRTYVGRERGYVAGVVRSGDEDGGILGGGDK